MSAQTHAGREGCGRIITVKGALFKIHFIHPLPLHAMRDGLAGLKQA